MNNIQYYANCRQNRQSQNQNSGYINYTSSWLAYYLVYWHIDNYFSLSVLVIKNSFKWFCTFAIFYWNTGVTFISPFNFVDLPTSLGKWLRLKRISVMLLANFLRRLEFLLSPIGYIISVGIMDKLSKFSLWALFISTQNLFFLSTLKTESNSVAFGRHTYLLCKLATIVLFNQSIFSFQHIKKYGWKDAFI